MSDLGMVPESREDKIRKADYLHGYAQGLSRASEARLSMEADAIFLLLRALVDDLTPATENAAEPVRKPRTTRKKAAPAATTQENLA